jgi:hypothetical protein
MKGFCEYDNETLGFMKDGEIVSSWATVRFPRMTPLHMLSFLDLMINGTVSSLHVFLMYTNINVFTSRS